MGYTAALLHRCQSQQQPSKGLRRSICSTCTSLSSCSSASRLSITQFSTAYGLRKRRAISTHSTRATGITEAPETHEGGGQHTFPQDAGAHSLGDAFFQEGALCGPPHLALCCRHFG